MNKPKFCIGEEVAVVGKGTTIDRTEVMACEYSEPGESILHRGNYRCSLGEWFYRTAHDFDDDGWWAEKTLRKLPPSKSFNDFMSEIKPVTA